MGSRLKKNSEAVAKRLASHQFTSEDGDEYSESSFGGFSDYFRRKKIKLQNLDAEIRQNSSQSPKPQIFKGIVASVNGYTQPSLNDLHRMVVEHGGGFLQYMDGKTNVTHIIASSLTPKKAVEFRRYRIVKPTWVVESVAAGRQLPWEDYRVVDEGSAQKLLGFQGGKLGSQVNRSQRGYKDQTNVSWYNSQMKAAAEEIEDDVEGVKAVASRRSGGDGDGVMAGWRTQSQTPKDERKSSFGGIEGSSFDNSVPTRDDEMASLSGIQTQPRKFLMSEVKTSLDLEDTIEDVGDDNRLKHPPTDPENYGFTSSMEEAMNAIEDVPLKSTENPAENLPKTETQKLYDATPAPARRPSLAKVQTPPEPEPPQQPNFGLKRTLSAEFLSPSKRARPIGPAEEHNMNLLKDPKMRQCSTANPQFIQQFFSESRLHHLSTWKSELKEKFQRMADAQTSSQSSQQNLRLFRRKPGARRYVMHVDFDSFFCAVSLLKEVEKEGPEVRSKPAAVAHGSGQGSEIASCNYPARKFGVKNGMWMKQALKLCPNISVLPYDFPAYEEASRKFYEAILGIGGVVQSVSIDECLVDITSLVLPAGGSDGLGVGEENIWREQEKADELGQKVRKRVKELTDCDVSVGIGGNILLAKVALRKAKPAGHYQIKTDEVLDFIGELTVQDLPGIAYSIGGRLAEMGIVFVKDVRQTTKDRLMTVLGPKTGEKIWDYSRGIDKTAVGEVVTRKTVSAEINWGIRFIGQEDAEEFVVNLCHELHKRMTSINVKGKSLMLKIMRKAADAPLDPPKHLGHGKCDNFNKTIELGVSTNDAELMGKQAVLMLRSYSFPPGELRGLGVMMTKLEPIRSGTEGGQSRLSFAKAVPKPLRKPLDDEIEEPLTPQKPRSKPSLGRGSSGSLEEDIDPESPEKPRETPAHPAAFIARQNEKDPSAKKPLNMFGTQFILPSQVDKSVLEELPMDIRSRLMSQGNNGTPSRAGSNIPSRMGSRQGSPSVQAKEMERSPRKQIEEQILPDGMDQEVFDALPGDIKAEVLAQYRAERPAPAGPSRQQNLPVPGSPLPKRVKSLGFTRPAPATKVAAPKTLVPLVQRGRKSGSRSTLTQSSFMINRTGEEGANPAAGLMEEDIDPDYLAAIPEELRREVIAEHKRARLAARSKLTASLKRKLPVPHVLKHQQVIKLPPRPRPTLGLESISEPSELRDAIETWHREARDAGPDEEDVRAISNYLVKVVLDERATEKGVGAVKWLGWMINDARGGAFQTQRAEKDWNDALVSVKEAVDRACRQRGVGGVDWDNA